jgi:hypothetical protein
MTSYPQHFLVHPGTLETLADTGRSVESLLAAFRRAGTVTPERYGAAERVEQADERAIALEERPTVKTARAGLDDRDIVVRYRALAFLAKEDPKFVAARAKDLLAVPNDPFRFEACAVLKKAADPAAKDALESLVREPKESRNPNVLRIRAVEALATCGDAGSVEVVAPFAKSGEFLNGLTRISVETLAALAARVKGARAPAAAALRESFPKPPADASARRACAALAKAVHEALEKVTGRRVPFPETWDEASRESLLRAWK